MKAFPGTIPVALKICAEELTIVTEKLRQQTVLRQPLDGSGSTTGADDFIHLRYNYEIIK